MTEPCPYNADAIQHRIDDELAPDAAAQFDAHAEQCPRCADALHRAAPLTGALSRLALQRDDFDLAARVRAKIARRTAWRYAALIGGPILLRVLDLLGAFGDGLMPRLIVLAAIVAGVGLLGFRPLTLIDPPIESDAAREGMTHEHA
jgi:anti-sigma factor RsiW